MVSLTVKWKQWETPDTLPAVRFQDQSGRFHNQKPRNLFQNSSSSLDNFIIHVCFKKEHGPIIAHHSSVTSAHWETHPSVVCRAVVELGDDLLAAVLGFDPRELELVRDERECGPVVVGDVHLETKKEESMPKNVEPDHSMWIRVFVNSGYVYMQSIF